MPNFDGTGPGGNGARSGRGRGPCAGNQSANFFGGFFGGRGRRCCQNFFQNSADEEKFLERRLKEIRDQKNSEKKSEN